MSAEDDPPLGYTRRASSSLRQVCLTPHTATLTRGRLSLLPLSAKCGTQRTG